MEENKNIGLVTRASAYQKAREDLRSKINEKWAKFW
jgi:hypothetical protein